MELAVEAAQSRDLPDFLEQFALRSTRMLDAIWEAWPFTVARNGTSRHAGKRRRYNGSQRRLAHFVRASKPERCRDSTIPKRLPRHAPS